MVPLKASKIVELAYRLSCQKSCCWRTFEASVVSEIVMTTGGRGAARAT